jgi:uncharacterized protein YbaR (Trm112 family)
MVGQSGFEVPERVRALVCCPACRGDLTPRDDGLGCPTCAVVYPVHDRIPWLRVSDGQRSERGQARRERGR